MVEYLTSNSNKSHKSVHCHVAQVTVGDSLSPTTCHNLGCQLLVNCLSQVQPFHALSINNIVRVLSIHVPLLPTRTICYLVLARLGGWVLDCAYYQLQIWLDIPPKVSSVQQGDEYLSMLCAEVELCYTKDGIKTTLPHYLNLSVTKQTSWVH